MLLLVQFEAWQQVQQVLLELQLAMLVLEPIFGFVMAILVDWGLVKLLQLIKAVPLPHWPIKPIKQLELRVILWLREDQP